MFNTSPILYLVNGLYGVSQHFYSDGQTRGRVMKSNNSYDFEDKPQNLKQWLIKHDTIVLCILITATVSIFYLP